MHGPYSFVSPQELEFVGHCYKWEGAYGMQLHSHQVFVANSAC